MSAYTIFIAIAISVVLVVIVKAFFIRREKFEQPGPENNWEVKDRSKYQKGSGGYDADAGGA